MLFHVQMFFDLSSTRLSTLDAQKRLNDKQPEAELKQGRIHDNTVAGCWVGAVMSWVGAVMRWAGAVMIWAGACSNTNFPTLKMPKNAKSVTERRTDRPTDTVT